MKYAILLLGTLTPAIYAMHGIDIFENVRMQGSKGNVYFKALEKPINEALVHHTISIHNRLNPCLNELYAFSPQYGKEGLGQAVQAYKVSIYDPTGLFHEYIATINSVKEDALIYNAACILNHYASNTKYTYILPIQSDIVNVFVLEKDDAKLYALDSVSGATKTVPCAVFVLFNDKVHSSKNKLYEYNDLVRLLNQRNNVLEFRIALHKQAKAVICGLVDRDSLFGELPEEIVDCIKQAYILSFSTENHKKKVKLSVRA